MRAAVSRRGTARRRRCALAGATHPRRRRRRHRRRPPARRSAASVLVVVSLRGAADGLSLVVPHGDPVYYAGAPAHRDPAATGCWPRTHVRAAPGDGRAGADVERRQGGRRARHRPADRQPLALRGDGGDRGRRPRARRERVGWLNRLVGLHAGRVAAAGLGAGTSTMPTSLFGPGRLRCRPAASTTSSCRVPTTTAAAPTSLHIMWDRREARWAAACATTFEAINAFGAGPGRRGHRGSLPRLGLGQALATAARIIRGDVGVEVITVDQGDWDMHTDMGTPSGGGMAQRRRPRGLDRGVLRRPGDAAEQVTLVTLSEFGRRVVENDDYGTDHGYGNVMFVAGAGVRGGYYARGRGWPNSSTPTCSSRPTTARCSPRSCPSGSAPRSRRCSRA